MSPGIDRHLATARRLIQGALRRRGWELRRMAPAAPTAPSPIPDAAPGPASVDVPSGRTTAFSTEEYDVLPRGRYDFVARDYYSPIPDLAQLPEAVWTRRSPLAGLELDAEAAMAFVETELGPYIAELEVPQNDPGQPGRFFMRNGGFENHDASLLYGMIRAMRPGCVLELGSGYSTLLINQACRENATAGVTTVHDAYDPYPRPWVLGERLDAPSTLHAVSATEVPLETFRALTERDILFVDTTHTVKLASDVNFIILEVLPVLAPGVLVHFHDIFLPWEYPRSWPEEMHWYWAEQYLLQAFLAHNREFEILVPGHAIAREFPDRCAAAYPAAEYGFGAGSMWLRRREPSVSPTAGAQR